MSNSLYYKKGACKTSLEDSSIICLGVCPATKLDVVRRCSLGLLISVPGTLVPATKLDVVRRCSPRDGIEFFPGLMTTE